MIVSVENVLVSKKPGNQSTYFDKIKTKLKLMITIIFFPVWENKKNCTAVTKGTAGKMLQVLKLDENELNETEVDCFLPNSIGMKSFILS